MQPVAVVTLIAVAVTVAALAAYLIRVAFLLRHTSITLGTVVGAVRAIASATEPIGPVVGEIRSDLEATKGALESLLNKKTAGAYGHH